MLVSTDKKDGKLQSAWIWIGFIVLTTGVILFTTYGMSLGPISGEHAAWASFGSLLAGFFTIAATGATIATLLFLAKQNKDMQKVTQAQLDTLTFERYINHRKLFIEQLKDLEITHNNSFRFLNPNKLYSNLFPENGPLKCEFSNAPKFDEQGSGLNFTGKIISGYDGLEDECNLPHFDRNVTDLFVKHLVGFHNDVLMIERIRDEQEGDLKFSSTPYLINIFSLDEFFTVAVDVSNMILQFSGNTVLSSFKFKHESRWVRDALMEYFYIPKGYLPINICKKIFRVQSLVSIYFEAFKLKDSEQYLLFPATNKHLIGALGSSLSVNSLSKDIVFFDVVDKCFGEFKDYLGIKGVERPEFDAANMIASKLDVLRIR